MGAQRSKALLDVAGKPAIVRVLDAIFASGLVQEAVVLAPQYESDAFGKAISMFAAARVIAGGAMRQDSVRCGVEYLDHDARRPDFVLVHDAARCLVSRELIEKSIRAAFAQRAVTCAIPIVDSVVRVAEQGGAATAVDRRNLWAVQTPQVFAFELLLQAHRQGGSAATDDASLVERIHAIHIVEGERSNLKLTTPEDLKLAAILADS